MNILTMLKSERAFNRFLNHYDNFEFENIKEFELLQEKIITSDWEIAIIDKDVFLSDVEFQEADKFLVNKNIKVFYFDGTFSSIFENIDLFIKEKEEKARLDKENEKVKEIIKYVEVPVEVQKEVFRTEYKHIYTDFPNKKIGVMNLSRGAGSTFITTNLACMLAEYKLLTTVVEIPIEKSKIFTNLQFECRCEYLNKKYHSIIHDISLGSKIEKDYEFIIDDVNYLVADVRLDDIDINNWNYAKMLKLINLANKSKVTLLDINNSYYHKSVQDILEELDLLLVIINPIPTEILLNNNLLEELDLYNKDSNKVRYIINKANKGVDFKDLENYLNKPLLAKIPYFPADLVYKAFYEGNALYYYNNIKDDLKNSFIPLLREIVPLNLISDKNRNNDMKQEKKKFKLFKKNKKE